MKISQAKTQMMGGKGNVATPAPGKMLNAKASGANARGKSYGRFLPKG